jgi:carbonic anhydrase
MRKLLRGIVDFRLNLRDTKKKIFAELALGQSPDTLFVCCSDSRVAPNIFASTDPGDLFVIRNVANLVPPYQPDGSPQRDTSAGAAIEFSILNLPVTEVVVCGHSECGGMRALIAGREHIEAPNLAAWLKYGEPSLKRFKAGSPIGKNLANHNQLSQLNVLQQMEHLKTYPFIKKRIEEGTLKIHGWWFDIQEAEVYEYEEDEGVFNVIDETYAQVLLDRANLRTNKKAKSK